MCEHCNDGITLVKRNAFVWQRGDSGLIAVRQACGSPVLLSLTGDEYAKVIDLLGGRSTGTKLGAGETDDVNELTLGNHLTGIKKPRSQATKVAAIAVAEGFIEADYRGKGNGGLWLLPSEEGGDRSTDSVDGPSADRIVGRKSDPELLPNVAGTVETMQALAKRIGEVQVLDGRSWHFDLTKLDDADTASELDRIATWEREVSGAKYLYRFRVDDAEQAARCHDALAKAKSADEGGRRFSRLNTDRSDCSCLYIGSSQSLATRMRQHLGLAHGATYALQARHWRFAAPPAGGLHLDVTRFAPATDGAVLQALEDDLWSSESPRFGKMGGR